MKKAEAIPSSSQVYNIQSNVFTSTSHYIIHKYMYMYIFFFKKESGLLSFLLLLYRRRENRILNSAIHYISNGRIYIQNWKWLFI